MKNRANHFFEPPKVGENSHFRNGRSGFSFGKQNLSITKVLWQISTTEFGFCARNTDLRVRCKLGEPQLVQPSDQQLMSFRFFEAVQHAKQDAAHHDACDTDDAHGQVKWFEIREDLIHAAVFAELLAIVKHLDTAEIGRPFIVEWSVQSPAVFYPKAGAVEFDSMTARHNVVSKIAANDSSLQSDVKDRPDFSKRGYFPLLSAASLGRYDAWQAVRSH